MLNTRTRLAAVVAMILAVASIAPMANAQGYGGGPPPAGFAPRGPRMIPMMRAASWTTVETSGGQTWDGIWTFEDPAHTTMSGQWVNRQTGARVRARRMTVRREGRQLIIARGRLGNYVGTITGGGRSITGTMSWVSGRFTATANM
jgi:hypothetical protein